jgi:GntR family transcriptional repressor for pyruvate dehydrogenase complex
MSRVSGLAGLIRIMVLRGEIAPGGRLIEPQLREALRTSRPVLRDALRLLEGRGLLVAGDGGAMRVAELDHDELVGCLRARAALERLCAGVAAREPASADEAATLRDLTARRPDVASPSSAEATVAADRTFHLAVARLARDQACSDALDRLWDRVIIASHQSATWAHALAGVGSAGHRHLAEAVLLGESERASSIAEDHAFAALAAVSPAGSPA